MASQPSWLEGPKLTDLTVPTPWERFLSSLSSNPDRPALISLHQPPDLYSIPSLPPPSQGDAYLRWTYRGLYTAITRLATTLQAQGIVPGMPVVTFLPNGAEYILTKMASHMLGCLFAPLNPRALINAEEVNHLVKTFLLHAPVKRILIVADADSASGTVVLDSVIVDEAVKVLVHDPEAGPDGATEKGWLRFDHLMTTGGQLPSGRFSSPTDEMLLCTSGTTNLPKVCALTTAYLSATLHTLAQQPRHNFTGDKFICVAPNNHVAGTEAFMCALSFSGTILFPSARFDTDSFLRAVQLEEPTYGILVPTMVLALCRGRTEKIAKFRCVNLGASPVTQDVLRLCRDVLGCEKACGVFGSTEGAFVRTGERHVEELIGGSEDGYAAVGWGAAVGQVLKVCDPGDPKSVVPVGTVGELHISSPGVVRGYVGQESNAQFYEDEEGRAWYNTGDQARFDADGKVFVLGRYKDVIIRGGENIAPAAIEAVLEPTMGYLGIQIVGAPDQDGVAGEVPIVVTQKRVDSATASGIRDAVVGRMGAACAPDEVISLKDLGLEDYPRTAVGKVQKHKLAAFVKTYRQRRALAGNPTPPGSGGTNNSPTSPTDMRDLSPSLGHLVRVWSETIGIYDVKRHLSPETDVATLPVDSIAIMRVRDRLSKALGGKTLSLAELGKGGTIRDQATLLDSKQPESSSNANGVGERGKVGDQERQSPPEIEDMVHLTENPSLFGHTIKVVTQAVQGCGLTWEDVRAVMPASDFSAVSFRVGSMWHLNLKMVVITRNNISKTQLRKSLHRVIFNNPMMASFIVADAEKLGRNLALHVQVEVDEAFLDKYVLADAGTVKANSDMVDFAKRQHFPGCNDAVPPGPLSKIWLFDVEESGSAGFVMNANHSVFDNTFTQLVYEDLENALTKPDEPLRPHVAYQGWADSYYSLRSSPAARAAIAYHTAALAGLHVHRHALWPSHPPVYAPRDLHFPPSGENGVVKVFDVPGWLELRGSHLDVTSPIPLKAALALFLTGKTGHTHAMFAQVEAERKRWPFLPKSLGDYPASDVGGLTIQTVNNLVAIDPNESVIALLKRMQESQTLQTKYASAPRALVMDALGPESAELYPWIPSNATFNWVGANMPSSKDQYKQIEVVDVVISRGMFGFFVMGGMIVMKDGVKVWIKVQGATFEGSELDGFAASLQRLTQWLVREENWGREVNQSRGLS
ncbi:hypothetical protein QBC34DRAFT_443652, partial [Podospora aff. communis PSN243]